MLSPITRGRKTRNITAYDFEWIPKKLTIRLCGAYDERLGYRSYANIESFLLGELVPENAGRWFYAHAGGLADVQFVLEKIVQNPKYRVEASFSGSSAIIVHIKDGEHEWHFCDSYWLLRDKLVNIGKAIGMPKLKDYRCPGWPACGHTKETNQEDHCIFYSPMGELATYNEQDCKILWHAVVDFETAVIDLGGQLNMTIASTAMNLFRRSYLKSPIDNDHAVNEMARKAYIASRVEVFQFTCEKANYFDINSSFPFSMTFPQPGNVINRMSGRLPTKEGAIYIADCEISVPEMYLPAVPYRHKGRIYFPHKSRWRNWFSSVDIEMCQKYGGKIEQVFSCVEFEKRDDLAAYAKDLYKRRKNATTAFEKIVFKYLLNSLYGKFAETPEKTALLINPTSTLCPHKPRHPNNTCMETLFPGAMLCTHEALIPHEWVPISVHITALSRKWLYEYLHQCQEDVYYCDTDSVITTYELPTSMELGGLKREDEIEDGEFIAPKVYRVGTTVKAKGFSRMTLDKFYQLRAGNEIAIERMSRVKELFRKGEIRPYEQIFTKKFRGVLRPKRRRVGDQTMPWSISEIEDKFIPPQNVYQPITPPGSIGPIEFLQET